MKTMCGLELDMTRRWSAYSISLAFHSRLGNIKHVLRWAPVKRGSQRKRGFFDFCRFERGNGVTVADQSTKTSYRLSFVVRSFYAVSVTTNRHRTSAKCQMEGFSLLKELIRHLTTTPNCQSPCSVHFPRVKENCMAIGKQTSERNPQCSLQFTASHPRAILIQFWSLITKCRVWVLEMARSPGALDRKRENTAPRSWLIFPARVRPRFAVNQYRLLSVRRCNLWNSSMFKISWQVQHCFDMNHITRQFDHMPLWRKPTPDSDLCIYQDIQWFLCCKISSVLVSFNPCRFCSYCL